MWLLPIDPLLGGVALLLSLGELGSPLHHTGTWGDWFSNLKQLGLGLLDWSLQATNSAGPLT